VRLLDAEPVGDRAGEGRRARDLALRQQVDLQIEVIPQVSDLSGAVLCDRRKAGDRGGYAVLYAGIRRSLVALVLERTDVPADE